MKKMLIFLTLGLGACASEPYEMTFRCLNEEGPDIIIKTRLVDDDLYIDINGRFQTVLTLDAEASPGARYEDGYGIEFWVQGNRAYYTSFGAGVACVRE